MTASTTTTISIMLQVSNVTNHTLNSTEIYQLFEYTRFGVWLMCIVGTFLNVLVITTILYYRRKKKSPSDTYICNLAVADLLIVVGLPFFLEYAKHHPKLSREVVCSGLNACFYICLFAGVCFLINLSMDRYCVIVWGVELNRVRNNKRATCWVVIFWILAALMGMPHYLMYSHTNNECVGEFANETSGWFPVFLNTKVNTCGYLAPIALMAYTYNRMVRFIINYVGKWHMQTLHVLLVVVVSFASFWFPFNLALFLESIRLLAGTQNETLQTVITFCLYVGQFLAYVRACLNPGIYILVGTQMRKDMWTTLRVFACCCVKQEIPYQDIDIELQKDIQRRAKHTKRTHYDRKNAPMESGEEEFLL